MSNLTFQSSNFVSSRTDLPVLQNISDVLPSTRYELDSYGHWAFNGDNPLIDKVHARQLSIQPGASIQPIFSPQGVTLTNAKGSALLSDLIDSADANVTEILVAKTSSLGLYLLGTTLTNSSKTNENGFGAYAGTDSKDSDKPKIFMNMKPAIANAGGGFSGLTSGQVIDFTTPFLVAISVDKVKKTALLYTLKGDNESFISTTFSGNYEDSLKKIAIGNAYYDAVESGTRTTFAEAILYNKALSLNQIKVVAQRCKNRLKGMNIII